MQHYLIILSGRVQGVGCRIFIKNNANKYGIVGSVKNLLNGNVEIHAQAKRPQIDLFIQEIIKGTSYILVEDYSIRKMNTLVNQTAFVIFAD